MSFVLFKNDSDEKWKNIAFGSSKLILTVKRHHAFVLMRFAFDSAPHENSANSVSLA